MVHGHEGEGTFRLAGSSRAAAPDLSKDFTFVMATTSYREVARNTTIARAQSGDDGDDDDASSAFTLQSTRRMLSARAFIVPHVGSDFPLFKARYCIRGYATSFYPLICQKATH
jgi:hypothetical protein